uniref:Uncharacterized protein n=1 Tax=Eutreptiella gymnastica TaxID=73025 RepID=A0A7S4CYK5_9EUGL
MKSRRCAHTHQLPGAEVWGGVWDTGQGRLRPEALGSSRRAVQSTGGGYWGQRAACIMDTSHAPPKTARGHPHRRLKTRHGVESHACSTSHHQRALGLQWGNRWAAPVLSNVATCARNYNSRD